MNYSVFDPALRAVETALRNSSAPVIVAVDGRCASGKTTFSAYCAKVLPDCAVFSLDDFFLPPEKRTAERLAQAGGNVDYERAERELFAPLSRGANVTYAPFDCAIGGFRPPRTVPPHRLTIVEGSYSHHPVLAPYSTLKLFFTCDPTVQRERLRARAPEKLPAFLERWIPLEECYFSALSIPQQSDLILDTTHT